MIINNENMKDKNSDVLYEASIKMTSDDLEFAKPPMSIEFIIATFKKYDLRHIVIFSNDMSYIAKQNMEPHHPMYVDRSYQEDIELIIDLMTIERIRKIEYIDGILRRSPINEYSDV